MAINWQPYDPVKAAAETAAIKAANAARAARYPDKTSLFDEMLDWEPTCNSNIGRSVHDGQYHFNHDGVTGSASTLWGAQRSMDRAVIGQYI